MALGRESTALETLHWPSNGTFQGVLEIAPETHDARMRLPPGADVRLDRCVVTRVVRSEPAPSAYASAEPPGQVRDLADCTVLFVGRRHRALEDLRCRETVGLGRRIVRLIELSVTRELPFLVREPCQDPALDRREIGADQHISRPCTDQPARYVGCDRQRCAQGLDPGELAALDGGDRGVDVERLVRLPEVLRLEPPTGPPAGRRSIIEERLP